MTSQCIVIQLILSSKGSFWFTKGILYSNETLETQERVAKGFCVMRDGPKIWPISKSIWHASCLLLVSAMSRLHGVRTKFIWLQAAQVHVSRKSKRLNHEIVTRCVTRCFKSFKRNHWEFAHVIRNSMGKKYGRFTTINTLKYENFTRKINKTYSHLMNPLWFPAIFAV